MNPRLFKIYAQVLFAIAAISIGASSARADLQINLDEKASNTAAGIFVYDVTFNNSTANGTPAQRLQSGNNPTNFATLYDIQGFSSATLNSNFSTVFSLSTQAFGLTPDFVSPKDTALTNVSLTYIDGTRTADATFMSAFTITTTATGVNANGQYSSQVTKNTGTDAGTAVGSVGKVAVPLMLPEPSGIVAALAGLPCMGMLIGLIRRRRPADA